MNTDIVEGNKLICDFMLLNYRFVEYPNSQLNRWEVDRYGQWQEMKYHTSWDWLMPSWGKLSLVLVAKNRFDIIENFKDAVVKNDIAAAWDVIVNGIKIANE